MQTINTSFSLLLLPSIVFTFCKYYVSVNLKRTSKREKLSSFYRKLFNYSDIAKIHIHVYVCVFSWYYNFYNLFSNIL